MGNLKKSWASRNSILPIYLVCSVTSIFMIYQMYVKDQYIYAMVFCVLLGFCIGMLHALKHQRSIWSFTDDLIKRYEIVQGNYRRITEIHDNFVNNVNKLLEEMDAIGCPKCGRISFNINDVRQKYCARCGYHADQNPTNQN